MTEPNALLGCQIITTWKRYPLRYIFTSIKIVPYFDPGNISLASDRILEVAGRGKVFSGGGKNNRQSFDY